MSKWDKVNQPCPCGKSSDGYAIDNDGDGFCYGQCGGTYFSSGNKVDLDPKDITQEFVPHRGLNKKTLEKYYLITKVVRDTPEEDAFIYPNNAIKYRHLIKPKRSSFRSTGNMGTPLLYGLDKFVPGSLDSIAITEGEYDAASVYQMSGGSTAAVSVRSASSARLDCGHKDNWDKINAYKKIILIFDNDQPGQDALKAVAGLFDFKKVYVVRMNKHKDANAYLQAGDINDFNEELRNARRYTPDNIKSTFSEFKYALEVESEKVLAEYPFKGLQTALQGIHEGEIVCVKGEEGIGKTELLRAISHKALKTTGNPIGIIHLEEDNGITLRGIATYELGVPANNKEMNISNEEVLEAIINSVNGSEERLFVHTSFDVDDETIFLDNLRYLGSVCGCKIIFFDHISWLATGKEGEDERKKLDRISQRIKLLAKELKMAVIEISHVNDDGKTRGSRNITKVANTVIHLERNKTTSDSVEQNKLHFTIEKARTAGARTGPVGYAIFNEETGKLVDHEPEGSLLDT